MRSFWKVNHVDAGFVPQKLVTTTVLLGPEFWNRPDRQMAFHRQVLQRVGMLPGVEAVALTTWLPMTDTAHWWQVTFGTAKAVPSNVHWQVGQSAVSPAYFRVMHMRLLKGRLFSLDDTAASAPVVIINDRMAKEFFDGENPVGQRIRLGAEGMPWLTIVGIVADVRHLSLEATPSPETYVPFTQYRYLQLTHLVVRTRTDPRALFAAIRSAIHAADDTVPLFPVMTMEDRLAVSLAPRRFQMVALAIFGTLAILLAVVGVYGVLSEAVAGRQHEIAVRMALGAGPGNVMRLFLGHGVALATAGSVVGIAISILCGGYLKVLLYGVPSTDIPTYLVSSALILLVAAAACFGPARRAATTNPIELLRGAG